jgi:hypothetical protein
MNSDDFGLYLQVIADKKFADFFSPRVVFLTDLVTLSSWWQNGRRIFI